MVPIDHDPKKEPIVHCKFCGHDERCIWVDEVNDRLVKNSTCFTCDYWEERGQTLADSQGKQFPKAVVGWISWATCSLAA
jgi:hypothetical protein